MTGCGASPTSPTTTIALSHTTLSLERTATAQVTATSSGSNSTTDITATATWRSSNEQVARVTAGLVTAVGPGTATLTVERGGSRQTVAVTVRRRVYLAGAVSLTQPVGSTPQGSIGALEVLVDNATVGFIGFSSHGYARTVEFGRIAPERVVLPPGDHSFHLRTDTRPGDGISAYPFTVTFDGPARVVDIDTGEQISEVVFENRSGMFADDPTVTWTFTIGASTS